MDAFTTAYLTAALFTDDPNPRSGEFAEHDDWTIANMDPEWQARQVADCRQFQDAFADLIADDAEHAGRDFWYTRNGHGCGFWDGDWPEPAATVLTQGAHAFGEVDLQMSFEFER